MNRRNTRLSAALAAGCAILFAAGAASAQSSRIPSGNWRQRDRSSVREQNKAHDPWTFMFELRFGPYSPEVDEEFGGAQAPYGKTFAEGPEAPGKAAPDPGGIEDDPQFYFGVEVDWLPLRIPFVGLVGPGAGWGVTTTSTNAIVVSTGKPSDKVTTSLTIMPMHLSAVLRVDEIMRRTVIPVVPYAKFGVAMALWDMSEDGETARYTPAGASASILARGISYGTHLAIGGMLGLSWLGGRSNVSLRETMGITNTYMFGEWMFANIDGLGSKPQLHAGASTWVLGLALQL